jgi:tRNA1(Val) A37 N6-methylase TrmN6
MRGSFTELFSDGPSGIDETSRPLGPYFFIQKKSAGGGQRFTEDSVILSDFLLPLNDDDAVIDLGTGTGIIPHLIAWKSAVKKIIGVEVMEGPAGIARRNVALNNLSSRIEIIRRDYRELTGVFSNGSFSVVVSNPPYFKSASARISPSVERAVARNEVYGNLGDMLCAAKHLAGSYGRICFVFTLARLEETLKNVRANGLKTKRLFPVRRSGAGGQGVFLMEASMK